jgi:O-antigen/teichoic acid export membrane protein
VGIIINQSIKNSFSYYIGMIIGAVNTIILYPLVFNVNPEYLGLIQILIAYSIIFSTLTNLSLPSIIIKYFPFLKQKGQLFFFSCILSFIGFLVFCLFFYFLLNDVLISSVDYKLLENYSYYIVLLVFFISFSDVLNAFSRSHLDSSTPIFLNEVFLKVYSLITLIMYWKGYMNLDLFLKVYFFAYLFKFLILLLIQLRHKRLYFEFKASELDIKSMLTFGAFVILGSTSALLISKIDMLMLASYVNLEGVAYYTVAFYIGNAIMIPARSINSISSPLVAQAWKDNDLELISSIYYKSSINQLILGGGFFLCIWLNIDDIMLLLNSFSPKFSGGKYVVFFIAISRLTSLISGVNSAIVINSKYYKFDLLSNIPFLIFIVITNHLLIPIYGINGAAFATFLSTFLFIIIKLVFVYIKFKIHPFSINTFKTIALFILIYLIMNAIHFNINLYFDIVLKSALLALTLVPLVYIMKLSDDINKLILIVFRKIKLFL